jgi:hypothetical protein
MKFTILLTINAVLATVSGLACVLFPTHLLKCYGVSLSTMGLVVYQFWGTALIGVGMFTWFARVITDITLQRKFALSLLFTNGLSFVIAIRGQFAGANNSGWSTVTLFLLLTLGFGVFLFVRPGPRKCRMYNAEKTGNSRNLISRS